ncbi:MAG: biotin--[acetyl-CoA-carboxylase] ligase [Nanoarchaeota archaeon]|nr:biotin--[acetyl-CoA-carboxylase] ligase [Nanoarchaeota archaeon]
MTLLENYKLLNYNVELYDEISSTMNVCRDKLNSNSHLSYCIVSNSQTNGRGTKNRTWISAKGGLYFSFTIKKNNLDFLKNGGELDLTIIVSIVLKNFFLSLNCGEEIRIKWFNDIYFQDKKLAGILCEDYDKENIICGIGINVNNNLDESLNGISLRSILKRKLNLRDLLNLFLQYFEKYLKDKKLMEAEKIWGEFGDNNYILGKKVVYDKIEYEVINIKKNYFLELRNNNGNIKIISWEDTIVKDFILLN